MQLGELGRRGAFSGAGLDAVVEFQVVRDLELFEEPEDALRLGVLGADLVLCRQSSDTLGAGQDAGGRPISVKQLEHLHPGGGG